MTSIYMPSSATSGGGSSELAGQVYGNTSNTIISTAAVTNKQLTGLSSMTGAVTASDTISTGISKLSGNAGAASSNNIANQIVKRDEAGGFSAGVIKATSLEVSGTTKITLPLKDSTGANILQMAGTNNVLVGKSTMPVLSSGTNNVVVGNNNGSTTTSSSFNTLIGTDIAALGSGTTGWNSVVGNEAMANVSTGGIGNVAMGNKALYLLTSGENNTAIGMSAGYTETIPAKSAVTCRTSTFIGANSCPLTNALNNATAIGFQATGDANDTIQLGNTSVTAVKTNGTLYAAGLESIGTTLNIASANNTNTVNIGSGAGVQTINVGNNGTGATTINLGGAGDTVNISGTLNNITTTNTRVTDNTLVLNADGAAASAGTSGIYFEEGGVSNVSFMRISSDRSKMEMRTPTGVLMSLNQSLLTTVDAQFNSVTASNNVTAKAIMGIGLAGGTFVAPTSQGVGIAWNRNTLGRTCFTNQQGGGLGGWEWLNYSNTNVASANPQMTLDIDGNLAVIGGLRSPTAGGTAGTLNHYKEYTYTTKFTGPVAETPDVTIKIVRVGKMVTFNVKTPVSVMSTATSSFYSATSFPSRFYPDTVSTTMLNIPVFVDAYQIKPGVLRIPAHPGSLIITGIDDVAFPTAKNNGFSSFSVSWVL